MRRGRGRVRQPRAEQVHRRVRRQPIEAGDQPVARFGVRAWRAAAPCSPSAPAAGRAAASAAPPAARPRRPGRAAPRTRTCRGGCSRTPSPAAPCPDRPCARPGRGVTARRSSPPGRVIIFASMSADSGDLRRPSSGAIATSARSSRSLSSGCTNGSARSPQARTIAPATAARTSGDGVLQQRLQPVQRRAAEAGLGERGRAGGAHGGGLVLHRLAHQLAGRAARGRDQRGEGERAQRAAAWRCRRRSRSALSRRATPAAA